MFRILRNHSAREAVSRAYAAFRTRHPDYAAALFDEHFLRVRVIPLLATPDGAAALTPDYIARAWSDQFGGRIRGREHLIAGALPVAADFVHLLEGMLTPSMWGLSALPQLEVDW